MGPCVVGTTCRKMLIVAVMWWNSHVLVFIFFPSSPSCYNPAGGLFTLNVKLSRDWSEFHARGVSMSKNCWMKKTACRQNRRCSSKSRWSSSRYLLATSVGPKPWTPPSSVLVRTSHRHLLLFFEQEGFHRNSSVFWTLKGVCENECLAVWISPHHSGPWRPIGPQKVRKLTLKKVWNR